MTKERIEFTLNQTGWRVRQAAENLGVNYVSLYRAMKRHGVTRPEYVRKFNHNRIKTRCPKGHLYDEQNTHRDTKGFRRCRKCDVITKTLRRENEKSH